MKKKKETPGPIRGARPAGRMQKMRKKPKRTTFLMILLLLLIGTGIVFIVYKFRGDTLRDKTVPYRSSEEFQLAYLETEPLQGETFAQDLCVAPSGQVNEELIELPEGQMGALFDLDRQEVLYADGLYARVYPASITKLMTAMIALQSGKLDDTVVIQKEDLDLEAGSQVCGFLVGDKLTLDQLVHCLLVYSGNDAASAIARYVGKTQEDFVALMNDYAKQLGMTGTHFSNPHGLQAEDHYTTPYDIYLMLNEAAHYPEFLEIAQMSTYTVSFQHADGSDALITLASTDHYLTGEATPPKDITILGGKTGTTSDAGNCLAILTQNVYGDPYIYIVMNASTKELLYEQMNLLLEESNR